MKVVYAPQYYEDYTDETRVFLAGSIEMGVAEAWQDRFINELKDANITILNPRRLEWDSSWEQSINNLQFKEQVEWELKAQEDADLIIMYFDPATKSPITLLELGLFRKKPLVVCCPDGFWRQGNVEIVCNRYNIQFTRDKELFFKRIVGMLTK